MCSTTLREKKHTEEKMMIKIEWRGGAGESVDWLAGWWVGWLVGQVTRQQPGRKQDGRPLLRSFVHTLAKCERCC